MRLMHEASQHFERETASPPSTNSQGLAGWLLGVLRERKCRRGTRQKQLQLIEVLPLGGKRQLMLVDCAGERFLVGGGAENVQTIVRLQGADSLGVSVTKMDEPCR